MTKNFLSVAFKIVALSLLLILFTAISYGQDSVEMADTMRSNGKIYIVVAVCVTILTGLFLYTANVDRRLRKWEKEDGRK